MRSLPPENFSLKMWAPSQIRACQIHPLLLSLKLGIICTIVCLLLAYPLAMIFKWLKNQTAELCRIHFYSANVDELHAQDLSMASAVIQQRNCQCNLPVFGFGTRKNAQYTDCRCIWYGLRFSSVYDTANLQLHGKNQK